MPRIYVKSNTHILQKLGKGYSTPVGIGALKKDLDKESDIKPLAGQKLSASEALYGMMAWLTSKEKPITLSGAHDATEPARLTDAYVKANNLDEPADDYYKKLITPKYK